MAEVARLAEAIGNLNAALRELNVPYMVIGGVANLVWGQPRTTQDVDVTAAVPDNRVDEVITELGRRFTLLPEQPAEFMRQTRVLPLAAPNGTRIDLIRAGLPYEEAAIRRATVQELGGFRMPVATAEDLILHKLASERPRDREDAAGVIRRQLTNLDRGYLDPLVQSLAETLERPEIWDWYVGTIGS
jgi:hypothetical protein